MGTWLLSKSRFRGYQSQNNLPKQQQEGLVLTTQSRTQSRGSTRRRSNRRRSRGGGRPSGLPQDNFEVDESTLPDLGNLGAKTNDTLRQMAIDMGIKKVPTQRTDLVLAVLANNAESAGQLVGCLLYTSPSPRDLSTSRMPSSA